MENAAEYVCKEWIDEVLIVTSGVVPYPKELIEQFTETGVTVHLNLAKVQSVPGKKQFVEKVGDYTVLTTSISKITLKDFKTYKDTVEIKFSGKFNVIVGENNIGKSTMKN